LLALRHVNYKLLFDVAASRK